jgi:alanine-glyoxylate transaminase/serine-glyoxylate transaminase/serine-pyruvate transaminase
LVLIQEESLENVWDRHFRMHSLLKGDLLGMGLQFLVDDNYQLPEMNAVLCPRGIDEAAIRRHLLNEFGLEIGAGLGPLAGKIWRIGVMGYSARPENIALCISALRAVLPA